MKPKNRVPKRTKKVTVKSITGMAVSAAIGFFVGFFTVFSVDEFLVNVGTTEAVAALCILPLSFIGSFVLHIILHEGGHLIGGLLSGYQLTSFRIFQWSFVPVGGKIVVKRFHIPGTLGQCLMAPPEPVNGAFPFVLYNAGGSLANLLISALSLAPLMFSQNPYLRLSLLPFALAGFLLGVINIIPLKMGRLVNDGSNIRTLVKNPKSHRGFWVMLRANAFAAEGGRFRDLPRAWLCPPGESGDVAAVCDDDFDAMLGADKPDLSDAMMVSAACVRFNYLLDKHSFDRAKVLGEEIIAARQTLPILKDALCSELLFMEIIGKRRPEEIERLYTDDVKKYMKATTTHPSTCRSLYAYARLVSMDASGAKKAKTAFDKAAATYPNIGEIVGDRELMAMADESFNQNGG